MNLIICKMDDTVEDKRDLCFCLHGNIDKCILKIRSRLTRLKRVKLEPYNKLGILRRH
jgi:hypothetical protein